MRKASRKTNRATIDTAWQAAEGSLLQSGPLSVCSSNVRSAAVERCGRGQKVEVAQRCCPRRLTCLPSPNGTRYLLKAFFYQRRLVERNVPGRARVFDTDAPLPVKQPSVSPSSVLWTAAIPGHLLPFG